MIAFAEAPMRVPCPPLAALTFCLAVFSGGHRPVAAPAPVQSQDGKDVYDQIKAFALTGGTAEVANLSLTRDRVEMTLTGTLHFAAPVGGRVTGAVFTGRGTMRAEPPPSDFERDNLRRMIDADVVESDFDTAVLRWTDDTFDAIGAGRRDGAAPEQAQRLATAADARFTLETGTNLSARIAAALLNGERPGLFTAQFDGGRRGRFTCVLDHQGRIPVGSFRINGGEKALVYTHRPGPLYINDVWMASYSAADYAKGVVEYSDAHDLVDIGHYRLQLDLRQFARRVGLVARIDLQARADGVRAIPFKIGESLPLAREMRREKQLRVKSARAGDRVLSWVQEDWEGGFTLFLPEPAARGQALTVEVSLEGDFMDDGAVVPECYYPLDNVTWLPRHGYLDRATFDLTFLHRKRDRIASIGTRVSEEPDPGDPEAFVTRYRMEHPVALAVFALGPFERKTQQVTWESGSPPIPLEFNSVPSRVTAIKHDFILAELDNSVRYFAAMFGRYPYDTFGASFHPYGFGQGFPSMLMLPPAQRENKYTHAFIAHETAHQWWGNIVAWRSYRDQWLSEGFAEYSGLLYAGKRDREGPKAAADLIRELRESLRNPPRTALGVGSGRLNDVGPIILGLRLNTSKSLGAYQALIYNKGALVLRMLHFLMSHPSTYDDTAFLAMMKDFVERHRNGTASTEDFRAVANEHFPRTPTAQKFGLRDLNWFFRQWVYSTELPAYELEYTLAAQPDGSVLASGTVKQENAGPGWIMVLPIVFTFDGNQEARTTVHAAGPSTPFELKLPMKPRRVALDPDSWILSEKTTTRAR
jgi:hypothetical protein